MPVGTIQIRTAENTITILPVRIAGSYDERDRGLRDVGAELLETTFLLYAHDEVTTYGESYDMGGIRAPLSLAVIGGKGKVLGIRQATLETQSIDVDKDHRWALLAQQGWLDELGIQAGSQLETEAIRKFSPGPTETD